MGVKRQSVQEILDHRDWAELAAEAHYDAVSLARLCRVSRSTLERIFRQELQTTPQCWLEVMRDVAAVRMIDCGKRKKDIAELLGYNHQSHLSRKLRQAH